jgi:tetratricopeptide (TPR) repeat protein
MRLDSSAKYVLPDMVKIACRQTDRDYSELMRQLVTGYADEAADIEVVRLALSYMLGRLNSREDRERLLDEMLQMLGERSSILDSELATELGLLTAERADDANAVQFFWFAYNKNKYNKLAFAKLVELMGDQITPAMYLEHLRLALGENPLDMEAALTFAQYSEQLQLYETAAEAYEYCADLFRFLYPSKALPSSVYLPWAISSYNTQRDQHKCLQIASDVRQSGGFDLLLEAIAGKAAWKIGEQQRAKLILKAAGDKALESTVSIGRLEEYELRTSNYEQLAWFYCFASPDVDEALEWANKAYSSEPNSAIAAALLAYSLVLNGQTDWAKLLVDNYQHNQIADLALAQIQLAQGQKGLAIETLKSAIERDPGSLAAERAREILAEQGGEYVPPIDPGVALTVLRSRFGQTIVPAFASPGEMISVQLKLGGGRFSYGSDFGGSVVITNNSAEPLVISDAGLFKGNIRVDVSISGDLQGEIPKLVSVRSRPASAVEPGRSISVPLRLVTGELREVLATFPQASLDIEFTVFVDPVITGQGKITNRFGIKPAKAVVKRPGIELSRKYLQNRLDSLPKGRQGQKTRTVQLFTGLLMEQYAMANRDPLYRFVYADWMPDLLKSALVHSLADDDWVVRVHTMAGMLSLPADYELINAVSKNLDDAHWPARLMSIFLLAKSPSSNFNEVLDWAAQYDSNNLVRQMAISLGGKEPEQEPYPGPAMLEETDVELPE